MAGIESRAQYTVRVSPLQTGGIRISTSEEGKPTVNEDYASRTEAKATLYAEKTLMYASRLIFLGSTFFTTAHAALSVASDMLSRASELPGHDPRQALVLAAGVGTVTWVAETAINPIKKHLDSRLKSLKKSYQQGIVEDVYSY